MNMCIVQLLFIEDFVSHVGKDSFFCPSLWAEKSTVSEKKKN